MKCTHANIAHCSNQRNDSFAELKWRKVLVLSQVTLGATHNWETWSDYRRIATDSNWNASHRVVLFLEKERQWSTFCFFKMLCGGSGASSHAVCAWWPWLRLWRTGPARCQWNRATAAPPPSTRQTTPCSPPRLLWRSWTSAGPACWRKDSESSPPGTKRLLLLLLLFCLFVQTQLVWIHVVCCSYILLELVETERDYVRDLGLVVEVSPALTLHYCHLGLWVHKTVFSWKRVRVGKSANIGFWCF